MLEPILQLCDVYSLRSNSIHDFVQLLLRRHNNPDWGYRCSSLQIVLTDLAKFLDQRAEVLDLVRAIRNVPTNFVNNEDDGSVWLSSRGKLKGALNHDFDCYRRVSFTE